MISARVVLLTQFLTEDLRLTEEEIRALRDTLSARIERRSAAHAEPKRTLYLPDDPLDEL